jgi:ADP-ribosylglycohydrolase
MTQGELERRAEGALLGLAMGDAAGFPALFHRTLLIRNLKRRARLWTFSREADAWQVNKFSLPYTNSAPEEHLHLSATDDAEFAAVAALILADCGDDPSLEELFGGWEKFVVSHGDAIWSGVSERASIENARKGLRPPVTGNDNPHHFDDGAVARAVPVGLHYHGDPESAARIAGRLASISNAEDGVWAAQAMAASIAAAMTGASPAEAVAVGRAQIPEDSWLARKVALAASLLGEAGSGFAAVPLWNNHVVNGIYSFGNVAPETLAVAYAIVLATEGRLQAGLQLACMVPKQADSMPAMVGALAGALEGVEAVPATWAERLDRLKGVCIPHVAGLSLRALARGLVAESESLPA